MKIRLSEFSCELKMGLILFALFVLSFRNIRTDAAANFTCNDGLQIQADYFCDIHIDCADGTDERNTTKSCPECTSEHISCNSINNPVNRSCLIHRDYICNGTIVCHDVTPCDVGCASHYRCANTSECVSRSTVCDGDSCTGCDEDVEWTSGVGFKCVRNGRSCLLPQQLIADDVKDCDNGEDLCYVTEGDNLVLDTKLCFQCLDRSTIIPRHKVCDDVIDCPDLSDECLCEGEVPRICWDIRTPYAVPASNVTSCKIGEVSCGDGSCVKRTSVCDGIRDCDDARDEMFEFCRGTIKCVDATRLNVNETCRCEKQCKAIHGKLCDGIADCPAPGLGNQKWMEEPGYPDDECSEACFHPEILKFSCTFPLVDIQFDDAMFDSIQCEAEEAPLDPGMPTRRQYYVVTREHWCDGVVHCPLTDEDEAKSRCPGRFYCKAGRLISIPKSKVCDGVPDCDDLSDEINSACDDRFYCPVLGNTKISIERKYVCDSNVNCDDGSDEINCDDDGRFYCESGKPLFVSKRQKFDGRGDCVDWSDECPTKTKPPDHNMFSSRYELIANPVLRVLVWIMGIVAICGNTCVLIGEYRTLRRICAKTEVSASLQANHMLVFNLALGDLLMGVYLIMLGGAGVAYSGVYCANKLAWITSNICVTMGVFVVVSSETSVVTMVLLTSFRLYAVFKPFDSATRPRTRVVALLIATAWMSSLLIALLPLSAHLREVFAEKALLRHNPFFSNILVDFDSAKLFVQKLLLFDPQNKTNEFSARVFSADTWHDLQNIVSRDTNHPEYMMTSKWLGYYSANSVCIPKLFVTQDVAAWSFSFIVTSFNFLAFVFVSVAYVIIYVKSKTSSSVQKIRSVKSLKLSKALQRKIIRLVATDFFCWVPISIMAFLNVGGIKVPEICYVISAVILLPINSALNPILYSSFMDRYMEKMWKRSSILGSTLRTNDTTVINRSKFSSTRV